MRKEPTKKELYEVLDIKQEAIDELRAEIDKLHEINLSFTKQINRQVDTWIKNKARIKELEIALDNQDRQVHLAHCVSCRNGTTWFETCSWFEIHPLLTKE